MEPESREQGRYIEVDGVRIPVRGILLDATLAVFTIGLWFFWWILRLGLDVRHIGRTLDVPVLDRRNPALYLVLTLILPVLGIAGMLSATAAASANDLLAILAFAITMTSTVLGFVVLFRDVRRLHEATGAAVTWNGWIYLAAVLSFNGVPGLAYARYAINECLVAAALRGRATANFPLPFQSLPPM